MNPRTTSSTTSENESTVSIYLKSVDTKRYAARGRGGNMQDTGSNHMFRPEVENGESNSMLNRKSSASTFMLINQTTVS